MVVYWSLYRAAKELGVPDGQGLLAKPAGWYLRQAAMTTQAGPPLARAQLRRLVLTRLVLPQAMHQQALWYTQVLARSAGAAAGSCTLTHGRPQFGLMAGSVFLYLLADLRSEGLTAEAAAIDGACLAHAPAFAAAVGAATAARVQARLTAAALCRDHVQPHGCGDRRRFLRPLPSTPWSATRPLPARWLTLAQRKRSQRHRNPVCSSRRWGRAACRCEDHAGRGGSTFRCRPWAQQPFPFGSEFAWDSTGQEEVHLWTRHALPPGVAGLRRRQATPPLIPPSLCCRHYGFPGAARRALDAVLAFTPSIPNWAYMVRAFGQGTWSGTACLVHTLMQRGGQAQGSALGIGDFSNNAKETPYGGWERPLQHYRAGAHACVARPTSARAGASDVGTRRAERNSPAGGLQGRPGRRAPAQGGHRRHHWRPGQHRLQGSSQHGLPF